jgi:hypothetical protein
VVYQPVKGVMLSSRPVGGCPPPSRVATSEQIEFSQWVYRRIAIGVGEYAMSYDPPTIHARYSAGDIAMGRKSVSGGVMRAGPARIQF